MYTNVCVYVCVCVGGGGGGGGEIDSFAELIFSYQLLCFSDDGGDSCIGIIILQPGTRVGGVDVMG